MQPWAAGRSSGYNTAELRTEPTVTVTTGSNWTEFGKCAPIRTLGMRVLRDSYS